MVTLAIMYVNKACKESIMELRAKYIMQSDLSIAKAAEAINAEHSAVTLTAVRGADNPLAVRVITTEANDVDAFQRNPFSLEIFSNIFTWCKAILSSALIVTSLCNYFRPSAPRASSATHP
jgi:hypothetical protein